MTKVARFTVTLIILFMVKSISAQKINLSQNNCIELTQKQMEDIGFVFRNNKINYYALINTDMYCIYTFPDKGKFSASLSSEKQTEDKYFEDIYPAYVLNAEYKILFSTKKIHKEKLLPIILKPFLRKKSKDKYVFLFPYNDKLAKKISNILNIEEYLTRLEDIETNLGE